MNLTILPKNASFRSRQFIKKYILRDQILRLNSLSSRGVISARISL